MGWVWLIMLGAATGAILWAHGLPRTLASFAGAAMMLGAAGYALQGNPGLSGHPVVHERHVRDADPDLLALRRSMFGKFTFADGYFIAADAMSRSDKPELAVQVMLGGLRKAPRDAALWSGLGMAYVEHDGNVISPAARLSFEQALRLAPEHPGPRFYYGLSMVRADDFVGARDQWARALALSRPGSSTRTEIAQRLVLLDRLLAEQAAAQTRSR